MDSHIFDTLDEVREVTAKFIDDYNNEPPHKSLGGISPIKYRKLNIFVQEKTKTGMKAAIL